MPTHRRGQSLSEALALERSDQGSLVLSSDLPNQNLREGDEILGATINFEQLSKEEVLRVLKVMEPFNDKVHVFTKNNRSKSLGNLDQCVSPETMLNDSYNKLYNAKIKKFIKTTEDSSSNGESTSKPAPAGSSKVRPKHGTHLPRLGVDFGVLKMKPVRRDYADPDSAGDAEQVAYSSNLNLPPMGLGSIGAHVPQLKVNAQTPQLSSPDLNVSGSAAEDPSVNTATGIHLPKAGNPPEGLTLPNLERTQIGLESGGNLRAPKAKMDIKGSPDLHISVDEANSPFATDPQNVHIKGTNKESNMPNMDFSGPSTSGPEYELRTPSVPSSKLSLKRLKTPDLNVDDPPGLEGLPRIKLSGRSPDLDLDMSAEREFQSDLNGPNVAGPSGELTLTKSGLPGKGNVYVATPDLSIESPKVQGKIRAPNINAPEADLKRSKVEREIPAAALKGPSKKYKAPKFTMPKFDLPEIDVNGKLDLKAPDVDVSAPKFKGDIDFPGVDAKLDRNKPGKLDLDKDVSSGKLRLPKFSPKLFGSLPKKEDVDVNAGITTPELQMKSPKMNMDVPDMKAKSPNLDLSGGTDAPSVNLPNMDVKTQTPEINIGSPKIKMPKFKTPSSTSLAKPECDANFNGPDVSMNAPSVSLKTPDVNVAAPSGKFRKPDLGLSGPKLNGPEMNLGGDLNAPELKTPKADFKAPHLDPSNVIIYNRPKLDADTPDVSIGSPKGKLKMPKLKMPRFSLPNFKGPEIDGNLNGPELNAKTPSVDLSGPKPDLDVDVAGPSGKFKRPQMSLPDLGLSGPKLDGPNLDLKSPGLDVSGPSIGGGINAPDVKIPRADMPSGQLRMPELHGPDWHVRPPANDLKMPKFKLSGSLPKGPNLDLDADLKSPDLHVKSPEVKGGIDVPDGGLPGMDLKGPKLDVKGPDVNIGSPKTKLKMPKLKMPKINLPNVKGPEVNGNFDGPDVDINAPDVKLKGKRPSFEMPDVDLGADIGSGLRAPNIAMPDVNLKRPTLDFDTPKLDVDMPKGKVKMPTLTKPKAELHSPDLDVHAPKVDVNGPDVNIGSPKTKFKMPKLKFPKFSFPGLKGPEIDGPDVDVNVPDMNIRGSKPDLDMPDVDISGQSAKFSKPNPNLPSFDLSAPKFEGPNLDMKSPEVDISGSPKGKVKMPKLKMPKFSLPHLKGPEIDGNLNGPDLDANVPSVNLKGPKSDFDINAAGPSGKFKKPNLNFPDMGLSSPELDGPNLDLKSPDLDISGPKIGGELKAPNISMPNVNLKSPKIDLNTPKLNVDMPSGKVKMPTLAKPKAELHSPDLDVNAPSGKLKFPNMNLSGTLPKGPNLGLNADVNSPDLSLKSPKIKGAFESPDVDLPGMKLKAPKLDVGTPDVNIGSPKTRLKMPKLKMPKMSLPNIKGPEVDADIDGPDVDIKAPNAKLKGSKPLFEIPEVGFGRSLEKPHVSIPDVGFSSPDFNSGSPALNAKLPKGPNVNINSDLKTPDIRLRAPNSKIKGEFTSPKMDLPKIDSKAPRLDMNGPEVNIGLPEANIKKPKIKKPKGPKADINGELQGPDINLPNVDVDRVKGKIKMPSLNVSGPQANSPGMELSGPKLKGPAINMPDGKLPDSRVKGPRIEDVRGPNFDMNGPSGNIQGPQFDPSSATRKLGLPSFKLPQFGGPDLIRTGSDIDFGASLQPTNISPPNANLSTKAPQMRENLAGPGISSANMGVPKVTMRNPQLHQKNLDLDIDGPLLNTSKPSVKNCRSGATGVNMKMPALDVDGDVRPQHRKRSTKMDARASYPLSDAQSGHHSGFNHSDLNIDDFTGKDYVLRARGFKNAPQVAPAVNAGTNNHSQSQGSPSSYGDLYAKVQKPPKLPSNAQLPRLSQHSGTRAADGTDGYLVTVFPSKAQNPNPPNRKYQTLGGAEFYATNVDLEVPNENDLRGSTFFFSNLV